MAMTEKQKAALRKAQAEAKRKRDAKRAKAEAAKVRKVNIPRPDPAPDPAPNPAPDPGAESGGAGEPTASHEAGGSGADPGAERAAAQAAEKAADARPDDLAPPTKAEPEDAESAERRARYARQRRQVGLHAPAHYMIHRGVTARAFRLLGRKLARVELGTLGTIAYQTQPSGDVKPVATTVDRALALSVSELGALVTSGVSLESPIAPAIITGVLALGAILTARFGEEKDAHTNAPEQDFQKVDEAALQRAAEEQARHAEPGAEAARDAA